jgi:hypothetical protein
VENPSGETAGCGGPEILSRKNIENKKYCIWSEILWINLSIMRIDMFSLFMYLKIFVWICRYGELSPYSEQ